MPSRSFTLFIVPALTVMLLFAVPGLSAASPDTTWMSPESLPPFMQVPLQLAATTDPTGQGDDYYPLKAGEKAVIATISGPAIIFRIWSTSEKPPKSILHMKVDGKPATLVRQGTVSDDHLPDDPLRRLDGEGYWSYLPIAVRDKAVFTAESVHDEEMKFYLQVGYRAVSTEETRLVTEQYVQDVRTVMQRAEKDPYLGLAGLPSRDGQVTPNSPMNVAFDAPAIIRGMVIEAPGADFDSLAATRLIVTTDGARTIDVPLAALFCQYFTPHDYISAATSVQQGKMILRLPMPVGREIGFSLEPFDNGTPITSANIVLHVEENAPAPTYRLCAAYFAEITESNRPVRMADITGAGFFIGSNLAVDGVRRRTYIFLEGNEQFYVDGATTPTIEGTGAEDYFNGAWYFEAGMVTRLFHGVTHKFDGPPPRIAAYRYMLSDLVPFSRRFVADLQHGSRNSSPDSFYQGVVFWYQKDPGDVPPPMAVEIPPDPLEEFAEDAGTSWWWVALLVPFVFILITAFRRQRCCRPGA